MLPDGMRTRGTLELLGLAAALATIGAAVPVQAQARAGAVAARDIARNTVLTADDILPLGAPPADPGAVAPGWVTRRALRAGEVLAAPAVKPPKLVLAHTPVELRFRQGALLVTRRAIALTSGRAGDTVRVRLDARRELSARVVSAGVVDVDLTAPGTPARDIRVARRALLPTVAGPGPRNTP